MGASSSGPTRGALPAAYAVGSLGGSSPAAGAEGPPREPTAGFAANVPLGGGPPGPAWWSGAAGGPSPASSPTVPAAEANRSSRESAAAAGPVSSFASSYNCAHQSAS
ncbi:hypothetical protein [Streptomyces sp. AN091965]|uniref:hypothetical protein n=1 Tax=Streptomyces sp. AN091965 TaxID=2927803 RepID=UPI0035A8D958